MVAGCVCSLANYSVALEETRSKRVSDFRDLLCSLFPKAILFDVYFVKFFFRLSQCFSVTVGPTAVILGTCIHLNMTC